MTLVMISDNLTTLTFLLLLNRLKKCDFLLCLHCIGGLFMTISQNYLLLLLNRIKKCDFLFCLHCIGGLFLTISQNYIFVAFEPAQKVRFHWSKVVLSKLESVIVRRLANHPPTPDNHNAMWGGEMRYRFLGSKPTHPPRITTVIEKIKIKHAHWW